MPDLRRDPIQVEAMGTALHGRPSWDQFDDLTTMAVRDAGPQLWSRTDLEPTDVPLNTNGGQLSAGRLHGFGFIHEACVQLWGEAGDRQVPGDPEVGVACAGGGPMAGALLLTRRR